MMGSRQADAQLSDQIETRVSDSDEFEREERWAASRHKKLVRAQLT